MNAIEDIKIIGFDPARPPRVRKEAYIDLYFQLSQKPPEEWCDDFNNMGRSITPSPKIKKENSEFIDSYVNDMSYIASHLEAIKQILIDCTEQYVEKIRQREAALAASNAALQGEEGEQNRLNQIVASLNFDSQ